jgi:hypothetical protein
MHSTRLEAGAKRILDVAARTKSIARQPSLFALRIAGAITVLAAVASVAALTPARAADDQLDFLDQISRTNIPKICYHQTYALCAGSKCFTLNNVAYCSCSVLRGKSISSPFDYAGGDVCTINAAGVDNGYMVSTFSLPKQLIAPSGNEALYTCPRTSRAFYARCDGGICFTSTSGRSFPTLQGEDGKNKITCSCPVEAANRREGLEIIGPYPCKQEFFRNCDAGFTQTDTGSTLYDGTAIGATKLAIFLLYGRIPPLNTCPR